MIISIFTRSVNAAGLFRHTVMIHIMANTCHCLSPLFERFRCHRFWHQLLPSASRHQKAAGHIHIQSLPFDFLKQALPYHKSKSEYEKSALSIRYQKLPECLHIQGHVIIQRKDHFLCGKFQSQDCGAPGGKHRSVF